MKLYNEGCGDSIVDSSVQETIDVFRGLDDEVAVVNWRTFEWAFRSRVGGKAESLDQALEIDCLREGSNGRL